MNPDTAGFTTGTNPVPLPSLEDIRQVLETTTENHPFHPDAVGVDYADWCGTGSYGVFCTWSPTWGARNDADDAREQHTAHLVEEQAHAVAILLGHPLDPATDFSPNTTFHQRNPRTT